MAVTVPKPPVGFTLLKFREKANTSHPDAEPTFETKFAEFPEESATAHLSMVSSYRELVTAAPNPQELESRKYDFYAQNPNFNISFYTKNLEAATPEEITAYYAK